jgi:hypothetical protein
MVVIVSRDTELREMVMRYLKMEQETSDPMAIRFLRDIVSELETELKEVRKTAGSVENDPKPTCAAMTQQDAPRARKIE